MLKKKKMRLESVLGPWRHGSGMVAEARGKGLGTEWVARRGQQPAGPALSKLLREVQKPA